MLKDKTEEFPPSTVLLKLHLQLLPNLLGQRYQKRAEKMQVFYEKEHLGSFKNVNYLRFRRKSKKGVCGGSILEYWEGKILTCKQGISESFMDQLHTGSLRRDG